MSIAIGVGAAQPAVSPFAPLIVRDGVQQIGAFEVRPQLTDYIDFRVGDLPKKKITNPQFAARTNHQVWVRHCAVKMSAYQIFSNVEMIYPSIVARSIDDGAERIDDLRTSAIVQRQCERHACIAG